MPRSLFTWLKDIWAAWTRFAWNPRRVKWMKSWIDSVSNVAVCTLMTTWSDTISAPNDGDCGRSTYLILASADSESLSSPINSKPPTLWSAGENPSCVLHSGTSTEKDFGFPPVLSHQHTLLAASDAQTSPFLLFLFLGSCWKRKRAPIKLCRRMLRLQCVLHERKNLLTFSETATFVFQESLHVPAGEIKLRENGKTLSNDKRGH